MTYANHYTVTIQVEKEVKFNILFLEKMDFTLYMYI